VALPHKLDEGWKRGVDGAPKDPRWHQHDCVIQQVVQTYNQHLRNTPGYKPLDWKFIKAMAWTETGGANEHWKNNLMQIGNSTDPGLRAFLNGTEGGDLILLPEWKGQISASSAVKKTEHNIVVAVGYLLMRAANFNHQSVVSDDNIYETKVKPGDSLEKIAKAVGSTKEVMTRLNPTSKLSIGQTVKYQKASTQRLITGWKRISSDTVHGLYNGNKKPGMKEDYTMKIKYALNRIHGITESSLCRLVE
jgi:hypothetical protein